MLKQHITLGSMTDFRWGVVRPTSKKKKNSLAIEQGEELKRNTCISSLRFKEKIIR